MTPQEISDTVKCRKLFESKVQECQNELLSTAARENAAESARDKGKLTFENYHDVVRFCELLGYTEDQLCASVASACAKDGQMTRAREICW